MTEHITYGNIIIDNPVENMNSAKRRFVSKLIHLRNIYMFNEIVTNARVGTVLQDTSMYVYSNINTPVSSKLPTEPYQFGTLAGIRVYIDPMMRWDDNRIVISQDKLLLRKIKIDKILNKQNNIKVLNEILIDSKILDILL